ncbi:MAG: DNA internalization-related competence protein ComEC/Rec2 [Bacteroidota bacterium]
MPSPPSHPIRWRSRPALGIAVCFAAGIAAADLAPGVGLWTWAGIAVGAALVTVAAVGWARRRLVSLGALAATLGLGVALTALGGAWLSAWQDLPADHLAHLAARATFPVELAGRVADHPVETERGVRFTLAADSAAPAEAFVPVRGRVQVALWQPRDAYAPRIDFSGLQAGDRVRVAGTLRPLAPRRNPADFDYGTYLARRGIHATITGYDSTALTVIGTEAGVRDRVANSVRAHARAALQAHVRAEEPRAVLSALLLADRSRIDRATRAAFAATGLMHLLAISGLHVLLVGLSLHGLLKPVLHRLGWRWRTVEVVRAAVTLAVLGLYVVATGAPPSAVRALVMAALLIVGAATERPPNTLNALGVAALVLLLARPTFLFDVGFQLSFAAVGAIVALVPVFERGVPAWWTAGRARRWVTGMTLVSLAATLGTMPVLLFHFGRVPLAGLVLNLAAIPATTVTLAGGLFAVAFAGWAAPLADLAGASAEAAAHALLWISRTGAEWLPWSDVGGYVQSGWTLGAITLGLFALAFWPRPRVRWRLVAAAGLCAAVGAWQPVWTGAARPDLEVVFFDVGQGDAALLSLPNGRHVLVDAGVRDPYTDQGERTLLPHLRRYGVDRLDAVVVTHPHADHLGGLPALLRSVEVGQVVHNGQPYASRLYAETFWLMDSLGVRSRAVVGGDSLALDPAVHLQVLAPDLAPQPGAGANNGSVVLKVTYGETALLLTGDVEHEAESSLVAHYGDLLRSDVVKVGHHGSRTSSTPALVGRVVGDDPPLAVVSVAERNVHRLPNPEVLERWQAVGATVLQTWAEGAVWLRSDGQRVERVAWR